MRQRWDHYRKENYYANGIEFDEVIGILFEITNCMTSIRLIYFRKLLMI